MLLLSYFPFVAEFTGVLVHLHRYQQVARIPDYFNQLSRCSKTTLAKQGGSMTDEEAKLFETDELFNTCIEMRKWDEGAKGWWLQHATLAVSPTTHKR